MRRRPAREAGLSLLEVVISMVVLSAIVLIVAYSMFPLQRVSTTTVLNAEVDETARQIMAQIRRELRQSGQTGPVDQITSPATPVTAKTESGVLEFKMRTSLGSDPTADWSPAIRYDLQPDGTFTGVAGTPPRFRLVRTEAGEQVTIAKNLASLSLARFPNDETVAVEFEVLRPDPHWSSSDPPPPIRRSYRTRIATQNVQ